MENSFNDPPEEYVPQFSQDFPDEAEDQAEDILQDKPQDSKTVDLSNQSFCLGFGPSLDPNDVITPSHPESNVTFTDTNQCTDDDITNKLTQHLPLHVVNCFLAAGYDTTEVIADMHVTNKAGDSLETIEDYINKQYPSDISFTHRGGKICKFPPGHRIRIHSKSLKKAREYKGKTVNLTASNIADIGILCSWYTQESNSDRTFILNTEKKMK